MYFYFSFQTKSTRCSVLINKSIITASCLLLPSSSSSSLSHRYFLVLSLHKSVFKIKFLCKCTKQCVCSFAHSSFSPASTLYHNNKTLSSDSHNFISSSYIEHAAQNLPKARGEYLACLP